MQVRKHRACWPPAQCLLGPEATAHHSPLSWRGLVPTSLQGKEKVTVALQLLHELLILQEEGNSLVFQVLLPAAVLVTGGRPWHWRWASLSTHRLGGPGVTLRKSEHTGHLLKSMYTCTMRVRARMLSQNPPAPSCSSLLPMGPSHQPAFTETTQNCLCIRSRKDIKRTFPPTLGSPHSCFWNLSHPKKSICKQLNHLSMDSA